MNTIDTLLDDLTQKIQTASINGASSRDLLEMLPLPHQIDAVTALDLVTASSNTPISSNVRLLRI